MGDTPWSFVAHCMCILAYTPVGTGETYFAAFAALNFLVICETFLFAACLEMVCLLAACLSFFSARVLFSKSLLPGRLRRYLCG